MVVHTGAAGVMVGRAAQGQPWLCGQIAARLAGLPGPVASSVLQGAARHNTFIALAVAERLYGSDGLAIAAVATSLLIPTTNVTMVADTMA